MKDYHAYKSKKSQSLIRKKNKVASQSSLKIAFYWVIVIAVALFFVQQRISFIRLEKEVRLLMNEKNKIQLSILPLRLEERYLTQLDRVEEVAKKEMQLQTPRESQTISVSIGGNKETESE